MTRVDVRVSCDRCGADIASTQTYLNMPTTDAQAASHRDALASLVHRALWDAVQCGATLTPTSAHCAECARAREARA